MEMPAFVLCILIPAMGAALVYLAGRISRNDRVSAWMGLLVLLGAWIPFIQAVRQAAVGKVLAYTFGAISMRMDGLGLLLAGVALGLGTCATLFSVVYLRQETGQEKYHALFLILVTAIIGLGCASDLFNLWVWFETMAVSSYFLVMFHREQPAALEAGFKYLVLSAIGSALVVTGIAFLFAETGSLDLAVLGAAAESLSPMIILGIMFIIVGFGVKAAMVPFHTWLPDAHSQAPSGISAMLSGVVIEAGLVAILRVLGALPVQPGWLLAGFAAMNILVGNLMALRQDTVKRLLAYSSLAHVGYMLLGLSVSFLTGQPAGAQGSMFHLLTHAAMKASAFLAAGALLYALYPSKNEHASLRIADLEGASLRYPLVSFCFSLAVLGLSGLPPMAGFMSKWQIFVAGFRSGNGWLIGLVIFAALNSVLSLGYYAPLVNKLYRRQSSARVQQGVAIPVTFGLPIGILTAVVILLGILPALADILTASAAQAIIAGFGG